jgi:hypothetical protein
MKGVDIVDIEVDIYIDNMDRTEEGTSVRYIPPDAPFYVISLQTTYVKRNPKVACTVRTYKSVLTRSK